MLQILVDVFGPRLLPVPMAVRASGKPCLISQRRGHKPSDFTTPSSWSSLLRDIDDVLKWYQALPELSTLRVARGTRACRAAVGTRGRRRAVRPV